MLTKEYVEKVIKTLEEMGIEHLVVAMRDPDTGYDRLHARGSDWWKHGCAAHLHMLSAAQMEVHDPECEGCKDLMMRKKRSLEKQAEGHREIVGVLEQRITELEAVVEAAKEVREQPWFKVRSEGCAKRLSDTLRSLDGKEAPDA